MMNNYGHQYHCNAPLQCVMNSKNGYVSIVGFYNVSDLITHCELILEFTKKDNASTDIQLEKFRKNKKYTIKHNGKEVFSWVRGSIGTLDQLKQYLHNIA